MRHILFYMAVEYAHARIFFKKHVKNEEKFFTYSVFLLHMRLIELSSIFLSQSLHFSLIFLIVLSIYQKSLSSIGKIHASISVLIKSMLIKKKNNFAVLLLNKMSFLIQNGNLKSSRAFQSTLFQKFLS